jgi:ankyrin repeat protein
VANKVPSPCSSAGVFTLCAATCMLLGCSKPSNPTVPQNVIAVPQDVVEIINAIDMGDQTRLRALLENGAIPTPDGSPISPIRAAITHFANGALICDTKAMKLLLEHGANPNFIDQYSGFAPLEEALSMGEMECITLLRNAGASIDTHGKSGQSLMQFAVKGAERSGDIALLQLVVSWGVSPNAGIGGQDGRSFTALHEAAWILPPAKQEAIVAELLRLGTDPCIRDEGQTALDVAENLKRSPTAQASLRAAMTACPPNMK